MKDDWQPTVIKISAVITAMPRWVAALLAAEGLIIPPAWAGWWVIASAIMGACMAVVEGWAFSYIFSAWRSATGKAASVLLVLALISALLFVVVLTPYVAASVRHVTLSEILSADVALYAWSASVAASTIAIVASVGYAQRAKSTTQRPATPTHPAQPIPALPTHICGQCGASLGSSGALAAHVRWTHPKEPIAGKNGHEKDEKVSI